MPTWTTVQQVKSLTGKAVTDATIDIAEGILATLHGLIPGVERTLTGRDRYFLGMTAAYQAAWVADQPDLFERLDVSSAGQDGQSAAFKADALVLAPLARRALKKLSWKGARAIGTVAPRRVLNVNDDDWEDEHLPWRAV